MTFSLPIFYVILFSLIITTTITTATTATQFIESKCNNTAYPTTCIQSLSSYANKIHQNPRQLAHISLIIALAKASYTKTYMSHLCNQTHGLHPREVGALKDCLEEIEDVVDRLGKSVHEFKISIKAQPPEFKWHISNVVTWASAALTDENTCLDGFEDGLHVNNGRLKSVIKAQLSGVLQCTSNALALVTHFANQ